MKFEVSSFKFQAPEVGSVPPGREDLTREPGAGELSLEIPCGTVRNQRRFLFRKPLVLEDIITKINPNAEAQMSN